MITYIIVDDETASHDILKEYGKEVSFLDFKKSCYNAFEAMDYLNQHSVDLMFLDINMPKLSGFEFLATLSNPPEVIVTTAYKEFALEGYELNVHDYLLKPYGMQRFLTAVNKVHNSFGKKKGLFREQETQNVSQLFIKDDKKYYQIELNQILFVEGYGNYIKLHLEDKTIVSHQTLSSFKEKLPQKKFIQIHKSFIVSRDRIEFIEGNRVSIQQKLLPIGQTYKLNVSKLFQ